MKVSNIYARAKKYGGLHIEAASDFFYKVGTRFKVIVNGETIRVTVKKVYLDENDPTKLVVLMVDDGDSSFYNRGLDIRTAVGAVVEPDGWVDKNVVKAEPKVESKAKSKTKPTKNTKVRTRKVRNVDTGKVFDSIVAAANAYGINDSSKITKVCKGTKKSCGGYRWEYV